MRHKMDKAVGVQKRNLRTARRAKIFLVLFCVKCEAEAPEFARSINDDNQNVYRGTLSITIKVSEYVFPTYVVTLNSILFLFIQS